MIDRVRGRLVERSPTRVVVESAGLGLALDIPLSTFEKLPEDGEVILFCHLHLAGQVPRLIGFATAAERDLFRLLISVSGVGPTVALAVLSGSPTGSIIEAIRNEDENFLTRIKGVGKKTARRVIVELKERVEEVSGAGGESTVRDPVLADVIAALVSLGQTRHEAQRLASTARKRHPNASVETLLRESLKLR